MKPRGRVLHFAVTGVLLGGGALEAGCTPKHRGPYTNTGRMDGPPPDEDLHVNPGPEDRGLPPADDGTEEGGAAEGGAEDEAPADGGVADGGAADGGPGDPKAIADVNPGPIDEPEPPSTNNVRKFEEPKPKRKQ